jgi:hypothetical protein
MLTAKPGIGTDDKLCSVSNTPFNGPRAVIGWKCLVNPIGHQFAGFYGLVRERASQRVVFPVRKLTTPTGLTTGADSLAVLRQWV